MKTGSNLLKNFSIIYILLVTAVLLDMAGLFDVKLKQNGIEQIPKDYANSTYFSGYVDKTEAKIEEEKMSKLSTKELLDYLIKKQTYVMHAGGSIFGSEYTNSYDALDINYHNGNNIFEIDLNYTSDGYLVLVHGWTKRDYKLRLGVEYNEEKPVMSLEQFKNTLINRKYQTMCIDDLITFMKNNPYSYFMLNLKNGSNSNVTEKAMKTIVNLANKDENILNRLIIWGYNNTSIVEAKKVFNFEQIMLVYNKSLFDIFKDNNSIINYCKDNNISLILFPHDNYNVEMVKLAKNNGIYVITDTVDDEDIANDYLDDNVDLIISNKFKN